MNSDQLTDIAYEVARELEPQFSFDVFEVTDSQIIFQGDGRLRKIYLACLDNKSLKESIKTELIRLIQPRL